MTAAALPRAAVTRDEGPDGALARALRHAGLEPVHCPVIAIEPGPDAAALRAAALRLERYDWLAIASPRALRLLMEARRPRKLPARLRTAAVGERTALALLDAGAESVVSGLHPGAASLLEALREADTWPGRSVLLPRAAEGRADLGSGLRALGASVDEVVAYRTVARPADEVARRWSAARPDAAVIASPSAARALVAALGAGGVSRLAAVVAIGPTTAAELAALGVAAVVSEAADFESSALTLRRALCRTNGGV